MRSKLTRYGNVMQRLAAHSHTELAPADRDVAGCCFIYDGPSSGRDRTYGKITVRIAGKPTGVPVHRLAYGTAVRPLKPGEQLDHKCKRRRCWNPAHLEVVTGDENLRRRVYGSPEWVARLKAQVMARLDRA